MLSTVLVMILGAVNGDGGSVSPPDVEAEAVPPSIMTRGPLSVRRKGNGVENMGSMGAALMAGVDLDVNSVTELTSSSEADSQRLLFSQWQ